MSERMTSIRLLSLSSGSGWADYGRVSVPEMIRQIKERALILRDQSDAILAASDEDFHVETYEGPYARRRLEVIQQGKKP